MQTSHMINHFEKFLEMVFIDETYNVNSHGMVLYCIMIEDGYGLWAWACSILCCHHRRGYSTPEKDDAVL